ncbi:PucR family transcriptional regulator [Cryptosporangium minutisporangium]
MPFTLAHLLATPALRLALAPGAPPAGSPALSRPISAAHVSELTRPGPWLQGGELLMTVGLLLPMDAASCRAYVEDLRRAGACALGLGLGRELPYQMAPEPLVAAAADIGLPLLTVPEEVPFIAVTKTVFAAQAAEERRALERALEVQRRLTAAAAAGGVAGILGAWHHATGLAAGVLDLVGRPLATAGEAATALVDEAVAVLPTMARHGLRGSAVVDLPGRRASVQPVGAARLRGYAVVAGTPGPLLPVLVSLLSLEMERRHLAGDPERRRRVAVLGRLLAADAGRAAELLTGLGVTTRTLRGVAIEATAEGAADLAADIALALPGGLVRVASGGAVVELLAPDETAVAPLLDRFAAGRPAGIGGAVEPGTAATSLRQAVALLPASVRAGRPLSADEGVTSRLLWELAPPDVLRGFADTVLAALDETLTDTLRAWLEQNSSLEDAATELGVHRHTVRNRLDRVERLTGRSLAVAADRHELWLALRLREVAVAGATPGERDRERR